MPHTHSAPVRAALDEADRRDRTAAQARLLHAIQLLDERLPA